MKIAILSREKGSYSTKRLVEAGTKMGCQIDVLDYLSCYISINCKNSSIFYGDYELPRYDAIIPRIGPSKTFYGTSVVRQFETLGTYSINPSIAITRSRDKLRSLQILAMKGVDMPITGIAHSVKDTDYLLKSVGGAPVVIKLIEGTQGVGVVLAETTKAAESVIQAFMGLKANIIVQEYIKEAQGSDLRCIVLGDKVIAAMTRHAQPGEFRSNVHQGGTTKIAKISKEERLMAIKAVKILGLSFAGVDILRSSRGPLIMEVNSSPGLKGIEIATKKELAEMVIEFIIKSTKLNKKYYG